jgi:hypothetical protein
MHLLYASLAFWLFLYILLSALGTCKLGSFANSIHIHHASSQVCKLLAIMSVHTAVVRLLRLLLITLLYLEVAAAVPYSRHFRRNATLSSYDFIIVGGT